MNRSSLQNFADRILAKGRIGKHDVQELQRELLVDGVMTRLEAETLIGLDRKAGSAHASWSAYFIGALTDFVVWGSRPTGSIDAETAIWLASALTDGGHSPRAGRLVAELIREAQDIDAALLALADSQPAASPSAIAECALAA
jgi:hypothetical protein